jgi:hypothetical protein
MQHQFSLTPYGSTLIELKKIIKKRHRPNLYQIVGLFPWNKIFPDIFPETKPQNDDAKQNGSGLKIKGFKLLPPFCLGSTLSGQVCGIIFY